MKLYEPSALRLELAPIESARSSAPHVSATTRGAPLPESFAAYPARLVHGVIATLLMIQVGVHVAGAVYHQVVLKDRLLSRMGFGKRQAN